MELVLQTALPEEMLGSPGLPGVAPCAPGDWMRVDDAYAGQMALRRGLIGDQPLSVLWCEDVARPAAQELLDVALAGLPGLGFTLFGQAALCPDGSIQRLDRADPLRCLGQLVQEDFCILQKQGDEHVLTAAVLCFPASWRLSDKAGKPLSIIHDPVADYDANVTSRVQRLFDGVKAGRPLWRFNKLWYDDPALFQPRSETGPRRILPDEKTAPFTRSERQCLLRLPETNAVVFSIHTYLTQNA